MGQWEDSAGFDWRNEGHVCRFYDMSQKTAKRHDEENRQSG